MTVRRSGTGFSVTNCLKLRVRSFFGNSPASYRNQGGFKMSTFRALSTSLRTVWHGYEGALKNQPILTQMVTSAGLWYVSLVPASQDCCLGICSSPKLPVAHIRSDTDCASFRALGDVIAQRVEGSKRLEWRRTLSSSAYGAVIIGMVP